MDVVTGGGNATFTDTANLDGFGAINLGSFSVTNFEILDLGGGNADQLTFSSTQANALTDSVDGGKNTLRVDGDANDSLVTSDAGWGPSIGSTDIGVNSYSIYEHTDGVTKILVQNTIDQTGIQA